MSAEATIHALLSGLVATRVFPDVAPSGVARPFIVYQQVGGQGLVYAEGDMPNRENARMQIACWATTRSQAISLAQQAEALICASVLMARPMGARVSVHEEDTNLYGARQDFDCWAIR